MNEIELVVTAPAVSMLLLEGLKWLLRRWMGEPGVNFNDKFYFIFLAALGVLVRPLLAWLGIGEYQIPTDFMLFLKEVILVTLNATLSVAYYETSLKKYKAYSESLPE